MCDVIIRFKFETTTLHSLNTAKIVRYTQKERFLSFEWYFTLINDHEKCVVLTFVKPTALFRNLFGTQTFVEFMDKPHLLLVQVFVYRYVSLYDGVCILNARVEKKLTHYLDCVPKNEKGH